MSIGACYSIYYLVSNHKTQSRETRILGTVLSYDKDNGAIKNSDKNVVEVF